MIVDRSVRFMASTKSSSITSLMIVMLMFFSIISRVRKTLHGSSGEIGWLQEAPGMDPVKDGSARFRELLECIRYRLYMFLLVMFQ